MHAAAQRPRNFFSRREQWRLLLLVFSLGLVLLAMAEARRPDRWRWLWTADGADARSESPPVRPGAMRDVAAGGLLPGVKMAYLARVEDDTVFRSAEQDAWFHLLDLLRSNSASELDAASMGEVDYVQLLDQASVYRGRVVTVRGDARRVLYRSAPENGFGIDGYHQVVLRPDGGPSLPIIAYCLDLPDRFPDGPEVDEPVRVVGIFFKNCAMSTGRQIHVYPTLLARSLEWTRPVDSPRPEAGAGQIVLMVLGTALLGTLLALWLFRRSAPTSPDRGGARRIVVSLLAALWVPSVVAGDLSGSRDYLEMVGLGDAVLDRFEDGRPVDAEERRLMLEILYQVGRMDPATLDGWTERDAAISRWAALPSAHRGRMVALVGHVTRVSRIELSADDAARFEMDVAYRCDIRLTDASADAVVVAARVPKAWPLDRSFDQPASALAMFLKRIGESGGEGPVWLVARRVAWHPDHVDAHLGVHFGKALLGSLDVDVGLWDDVTQRGPLTGCDREPFYQVLHVAGQVGRRKLERLAKENLARRTRIWQAEADRLRDERDRLSPSESDGSQSASDPSRRSVATERVGRERAFLDRSLRQARRGTFPVLPLFNRPEANLGELVLLRGTARRAVKIDVAASAELGGGGDLVRRFALDHYYEIDLFTDDSENHPVVCCVRTLPEGFPEGPSIREPVCVAGFFFKSWAFRGRGGAGPDSEMTARAHRWQLAPIVIGCEPARPTPSPASGGGAASGLIGGGLFVMALAGIAALVAWYRLEDRRARRRSHGAR